MQKRFLKLIVLCVSALIALGLIGLGALLHRVDSKQSLSKSPANTKRKIAGNTENAGKTPTKKDSQTIIVQSAFKTFTVTYSRNIISVKGRRLDFSLKRKKCNAHILDQFNEDIDKFIRTQILENQKLKKPPAKPAEPITTVEVKIEGESRFVDGNTESGYIFMALPKEFLRMKWEEKLSCEKK